MTPLTQSNHDQSMDFKRYSAGQSALRQGCYQPNTDNSETLKLITPQALKWSLQAKTLFWIKLPLQLQVIRNWCLNIVFAGDSIAATDFDIDNQQAILR
ncbi:MAG: hypothetical protein H0A76_05605 [Candidatus Thiodubiliella endoseptemdiera]|uniref:Uncharacterized protein n=1 Tax=Candidatus Thiodubiliella endoseptemdiera TaxID=2738886 RepID=A0A853F0F8_9GAMM|nr:hypothetical protein [Candidatus Thiodubiliella endoseptemdiera]